MKEYVLKETVSGLKLFLSEQEGLKQVPSTDIFRLYPERRVYAFRGSMGVGKTTFIKQLCEDMEVVDIVNSPTFAIVNVYETKRGDEIYHFDCYRLKNLQEAVDMGTEEYLYSGRYCLIEWPEMIEDLLPDDRVEVTLGLLPNGDRIMRL